ncbi:MAG: phospholipase D-like domain-containing protein [Planctomycetota bacterium]|nr:phospholipase D-like domain-containing protein [Planctomycetota bacterium]
MIDVLPTAWSNAFSNLVVNAGNCVRICSPFIGLEPCVSLAKMVPISVRDNLRIDLLTNLSYDNMVSRATDVRGLMHLYDSFPKCDIRFLPQLHAKIYSSDNTSIVTSANFTRSGFHRNQEYGVVVRDIATVGIIFEDVKRFHEIGTSVSRDELQTFDAIVDELSELQRGMQKSVRQTAKAAFEKKSRSAEQQLLQIRAKTVGAHAGFAETIRFVLRQKGKATTKELYQEVQAIHSDLCDDSVKLVISGVEWSQAKWKHRVRHAQQFLARRDEITRQGVFWILK